MHLLPHGKPDSCLEISNHRRVDVRNPLGISEDMQPWRRIYVSYLADRGVNGSCFVEKN